MATKDIPREHWEHWTAEELASKYYDAARLRATELTVEGEDYTTSYLWSLYQILEQLVREHKQICAQYRDGENSVLIESIAGAVSATASGLEIVLEADSRGTVSADQLLHFASLPTQRLYADHLKLQTVCELLVAHYNAKLADYSTE